MRRMADFQNRVFERFAAARDLGFLDFYGEFPRDPDLFSDAIHLTLAGVRLEAWFYLQKLIPLLEDRIDHGVWPRPMRRRSALNPQTAFTGEPDLVSKGTLLSQCGR